MVGAGLILSFHRRRRSSPRCPPAVWATSYRWVKRTAGAHGQDTILRRQTSISKNSGNIVGIEAPVDVVGGARARQYARQRVRDQAGEDVEMRQYFLHAANSVKRCTDVSKAPAAMLLCSSSCCRRYRRRWRPFMLIIKAGSKLSSNKESNSSNCMKHVC